MAGAFLCPRLEKTSWETGSFVSLVSEVLLRDRQGSGEGKQAHLSAMGPGRSADQKGDGVLAGKDRSHICSAL